MFNEYAGSREIFRVFREIKINRTQLDYDFHLFFTNHMNPAIKVEDGQQYPVS